MYNWGANNIWMCRCAYKHNSMKKYLLHKNVFSLMWNIEGCQTETSSF